VNEGNAQLLQQLKDIHGAAAPGWWPPAPGWWVLAALLLTGLFFAIRWALARLAVKRRRRNWLRALDRIERDCSPEEKPGEYLARINRLFRAVALRAFPDTSCARLQGEEWVTFIRSLLPEKANPGGLSALARGPYEAAPVFDAASLRELARVWVSRYG
jgi:hypothetical protein